MLAGPPAQTVVADPPGQGVGGSPALRAEQEALLARTRRNPTDYDATFAYVDGSRRLRDFEAAVGALERLLFYNPGLTRARYELGAVYFQLGSYDLSARHLRDTLASPDLEIATRARASVLLADAEKQRAQSRWTAFLQTGLRYQSNATFIPAGGVVRISGEDFLLQPRFRRRSDGSAFGIAAIGHDYDLENQRGDTLETRFLAFGTKQFRATEYDFGFVEASFGPRLGLPELARGASIKPYVVGGAAFVRVEDAPYISSGGGGVSVRLPVWDGLTVEPGVEGRAISVSNRSNVGFSTVSTGSAVSAYLVTTARLTDSIELETRSLALWGDGRFPWQSFVKTGFNAALNIQFEPPSDMIGRKWRVAPFVGVAHTDFDSPNPLVDPGRKRRDTDYRAGATFDAPLTETFGISATVQYDWYTSNLPNFRQENLTVLGGPTARF